MSQVVDSLDVGLKDKIMTNYESLISATLKRLSNLLVQGLGIESSEINEQMVDFE